MGIADAVAALHREAARTPEHLDVRAAQSATCWPRSAAMSPTPDCAILRGASPLPSRSWLAQEPFALTTFPNDEAYDELVVVRDIRFHSLCMHHLLPFHGVAHVAYLFLSLVTA